MSELIPVSTTLLPAGLSSVSDAVARYVEVGLAGAANTRRAYAADLRTFEQYCRDHDLEHLPAAVTSVAQYVTHLADQPRKLATIRRHLSAIAKAHELAGYQTPTDSKQLAVVLEGITRVLGKRQKQAPAFSVDELKRAINGLDLTTPAGLRDRALLLLGFAGAFRRSELVALNVEYLELTSQALMIHLDKSKTNQFGEVEDKAVFYAPDDRYCPVRSVQAWLDVLGRNTGPLFVSLKRVPKQVAQPSPFRLSDISANKLVQQHLGPQYSAHSLRASFVTIAVEAGQSNKAIKNQTKQKTDAMIERYARLDDVKRFNAAKFLGL